MARTTLLALLVLTIGAQISLALKLRLIPKLDPEQYHKHPDSLKGGAVYVGLDLKSNRYFYDFSPIKSRNYSAVGFLREDTNSTGWAYLEITNNVTGIIPNALIPKFNDSVRAYTAGIAEGILTKHLINLHYLNILDGYCDDDPAYCKRLDKFITENIAWMNKMVIAKRATSSLWHHVGIFLEQLAGIADGASGTFFGPRSNLFRAARVYLMNLNGDLGDLEAALNKIEKFRQNRGGCSAMVKITDDGDLIASHDTWTSYQSMLRIIKNYDLLMLHKHEGDIDFNDDDPRHVHFRAATVKFSSYPAFITSVDDFYISGRRLAVFETTIGNYNSTLWKYVQPVSTIPTAIRGVVATRLARHAKEWHEIFSNFNSGTYNNEWIVVDYNAWQQRKTYPKAPILVVSNQMPGFFLTKDYTANLLRNSYFASYNIPSMPETFSISNSTAMVEQWGPIYNYSNCPRGLIFARNHSRVHDIGSAMALMRYNNFKNDPLSRCKGCNPPYSAELAIAARCDLNDRNGSYPIEFLSWRSHGAIDTKMTNADLISSFNFIAQSGPTFDQQPPFRWSTSGMSMKDTPHYGQPDTFRFAPVIYE